ncbi:MAG: hypothetical protein JWO67_7426 [Streptosporangiaceae bacterium]|nr:hypothetical protein [Streptosporangiaceae bacterium]
MSFFEDAEAVLGKDLVDKLRAQAAQSLIDKPLTEAQLTLLAGLLAMDVPNPEPAADNKVA